MRFTSLLVTTCIVMLLNHAPAAARVDLDSGLSFAIVARAQYPDGTRQWTSAVDRFRRLDLQPSVFAADNGCGEGTPTQHFWSVGCRFAAWQLQLELWRSLPVHEQLVRVHAAVNALPYVADRVNWGEADRWETPAEMFDRGGDCEGFAVAKYDALLALGFDRNAMRIAIVWDAQDREEHAVLIVHTANETWLLDNKLAAPQPAGDFATRYRLIYAVGPDGARTPVIEPRAVAAAFAGARLSKNGRMLVWKVQARKRLPVVSATPSPSVATDMIPPSIAVADHARVRPGPATDEAVSAAAEMPGFSAHAQVVANTANQPPRPIGDVNTPVALQLTIWADDDRQQTGDPFGLTFRFNRAERPTFVDAVAMWSGLYAAG